MKRAHVLSHPVTVTCFTVPLEGSNMFDFDKALLAYFSLLCRSLATECKATISFSIFC